MLAGEIARFPCVSRMAPHRSVQNALVLATSAPEAGREGCAEFAGTAGDEPSVLVGEAFAVGAEGMGVGDELRPESGEQRASQADSDKARGTRASFGFMGARLDQDRFKKQTHGLGAAATL